MAQLKVPRSDGFGKNTAKWYVEYSTVKTARIVRVVVASPGDVKAERDSVDPILKRLNVSVAADRGIRLESVLWETDTHPGFHVDGPQGIIDPLLNIRDSDLLIGIFWNRFGTPVFDAGSGTEHEFRIAFEQWKSHKRPQIMVYLNQKPCNLRTINEIEQRLHVVRFFENFPQEGLWASYNGIRQFREQLQTHLTNWIRSEFPAGTASSATRLVTSSPSGKPRSDENTSRVIISGESVSISRSLESFIPTSPVIVWRPLPPAGDVDIFRLLDWRVRATPLFGRGADLRQLMDWANSEPRILVRFLEGPGGAGKTRLAFEAAEKLREEGWSAGQVFLDRHSAIPFADKGLFLVVDYPEACHAGVKILLRDLARVEGSPGRIRVLLLSRYPLREWRSPIDGAMAAGICDTQELRIGSLSSTDGLQLFRSAVERFANHTGQQPPFISDETVSNWLTQRESQSLPVFIVAAALHCVITRASELSLTGAEIVGALVRREMMRLDNAGRDSRWGDHGASRIIGLAAASDGLGAAAILRLATDRDFGLPAQQPIEAVKSLHLWVGDRVPAPTPDVVAAELLFQVLSESPERASQWLWASLADNAHANVPGLGRIGFDIATLHGPEELVRFSNWLADCIAGQPARAAQWRAIFEQEVPIAVSRLAVSIGKCLLSGEKISPLDRALILNKLSQRLADTGELAESLRCSDEATSLIESLAEADPKYKPDLARSFTTLASCLRSQKRAKDGADAAAKAVDIWRRLDANAPEVYQADIARGLRIWSDCLSDTGTSKRALELGKEAVEIWRKLAATDANQFEPELAGALNSLSVSLWHSGDQEGSTEAIRQSIVIWQRLVNEFPGRYEPDLALGLNNLSRNLSSGKKDAAGALSAIQQAIRIYGAVVAANPVRYGLRLAQSLENLHQDLKRTGEARAAVQALRQSLDIKKKLAASYPVHFEPTSLEMLDRFSLELSTAKDEVDAAALLDAIETAEKTVCILLVRGENPEGRSVFAYVAVRASRLEEFMLAQTKGMFHPGNFGEVVNSGFGDPPDAVRIQMEVEYGFNHQSMIDIPDPEAAREISRNLEESDFS